MRFLLVILTLRLVCLVSLANTTYYEVSKVVGEKEKMERILKTIRKEGNGTWIGPNAGQEKTFFVFQQVEGQYYLAGHEIRGRVFEVKGRRLEYLLQMPKGTPLIADDEVIRGFMSPTDEIYSGKNVLGAKRNLKIWRWRFRPEEPVAATVETLISKLKAGYRFRYSLGYAACKECGGAGELKGLRRCSECSGKGRAENWMILVWKN